MGHCIRAVIGSRESVRRLVEDWLRAKVVELPQGFGMIFMTDDLLEDVGELLEVSDELPFSELENFTEEVKELMELMSKPTISEVWERRRACSMKTDEQLSDRAAAAEQ